MMQVIFFFVDRIHFFFFSYLSDIKGATQFGNPIFFKIKYFVIFNKIFRNQSVYVLWLILK